MTDLYSIKDVAQIFDLEISRLRYWAQTGFVNPSVRRGSRVYYTFQDLVALRTAKDLLDAGLSMQKVRKNLESLRHFLPDVSRPASRMRIVSDGESVVALDRGTAFEPTSGQVVMSFALDALSSDVADVLALPTPMMAHESPAQEAIDSNAVSDQTRLVDELREASEYPIDNDYATDDGDYELDHADQNDSPLATVHVLNPSVTGGHAPSAPSDNDIIAPVAEPAADETALAADTIAADFAFAANANHADATDTDFPVVGTAEAAALAETAEIAEAAALAETAETAEAAALAETAESARAETAEAALPTGDRDPLASGYQCFLLACEAEDRDEIDDAEALYRDAIARDPTLSAAYTNLGNLLYRSGDLAQARIVYEHALELEPAQAEARFNLGNVLEDLGETDQAIAELRRVCWTHPEFADAHYNLGLVLARVGGLTQARQHLERYLALETDPDSRWAERARTFLHSLTGARVAAVASR